MPATEFSGSGMSSSRLEVKTSSYGKSSDRLATEFKERDLQARIKRAFNRLSRFGMKL